MTLPASATVAAITRLSGPPRPIPAGQLADEIAKGRCVDWEIVNFIHAATIADLLTKSTGKLYVPVDREQWTAPRYSVVRVPRVGDLVSKSFNGDTYVVGKVVRVSKSLRRVVVAHLDDGRTWAFYRRRLTASWLLDGMWALVRGHHEERNPHL